MCNDCTDREVFRGSLICRPVVRISTSDVPCQSASAFQRRQDGGRGWPATEQRRGQELQKLQIVSSLSHRNAMKIWRTSRKPPFQIRIFGTSRTSRIKDFGIPPWRSGGPSQMPWLVCDYALCRESWQHGNMDQQMFGASILSIFVMQIHKEKKKNQVNTDHDDGMFHPYFCSAHRIADVYRWATSLSRSFRRSFDAVEWLRYWPNPALAAGLFGAAAITDRDVVGKCPPN